MRRELFLKSQLFEWNRKWNQVCLWIFFCYSDTWSVRSMNLYICFYLSSWNPKSAQRNGFDDNTANIASAVFLSTSECFSLVKLNCGISSTSMWETILIFNNDYEQVHTEGQILRHQVKFCFGKQGQRAGGVVLLSWSPQLMIHHTHSETEKQSSGNREKEMNDAVELV